MSATSASAEKTERLLNLILALKSTRRPIPKEKLRAALPAYAEAPSDEAFDRMFERDKDELREMGIPITTTVVDVLFDDEVGYRIDSSETSLPEISFEPEEVAALALAARAWSTASVSGAATAGLRKLRLAGVEIDESLAAGVEPRIRTADPAFEPVRAALSARQPIKFEYRKNDGSVDVRQVRPWALKHWHGRWYLTGYDVDRGAERAFRLSRVVGPVRKKGRAGSYEVPVDHVPEVSLAAQAPEPVGTATIRLRHGRGHLLRQAATRIHDIDHRWTEVELPYERGRTERDVAALGSHAVAVAPAELVDGVREALRRVLESHSGHRDRDDRAAAPRAGEPGQ